MARNEPEISNIRGLCLNFNVQACYASVGTTFVKWRVKVKRFWKLLSKEAVRTLSHSTINIHN